MAFPAGAWADRGYSPRLIGAGFAALIASDLVLAQASGAAGVLIGAALWGLHLALTQGLLSALVAAVAPADLRGTAFGVFNLVSGIALLIASVLAGLLWDVVGTRVDVLRGRRVHARRMDRVTGARRDLPSLAGELSPSEQLPGLEPDAEFREPGVAVAVKPVAAADEQLDAIGHQRVAQPELELRPPGLVAKDLAQQRPILAGNRTRAAAPHAPVVNAARL